MVSLIQGIIVVQNWKLGNRKGLAPIIANLILIALTAGGGAVTYGFAQEIISDTQVTSTIHIESVRIIGYDIRDVEELKSHNGLYMKLNTAGVADGVKSESERIAIYVQNDSSQKIEIGELRFAGTVYEFSGSYNVLDTFDANFSPPQGEYVILTKNPDILVDSDAAELQGGRLATIVIGLDDSFKIGRTSQLKITTTNGFVIVGSLVIGNAQYKNSDYSVVTYTINPNPEDDPPNEDDSPNEDDPPNEDNPVCEPVVVNFDYDDLENPVPAGTIVSGQWHGIDIHISAINDKVGHPDKAIIFDSNNPTGGDNDLGAPWPNGNIEPDANLGNLLIIAEDIVDNNGDGLVDDPDDEVKGGTIFFQSTSSHCYLGFDLIDIESNESNSGYIEILLDGGGIMHLNFNAFPGNTYGNNSANSVVIIAEQIGDTFKEVLIHLNGSGAIDNVIFG